MSSQISDSLPACFNAYSWFSAVDLQYVRLRIYLKYIPRLTEGIERGRIEIDT